MCKFGLLLFGTLYFGRNSGLDYRVCILITERISSNRLTGRNLLLRLFHIPSIVTINYLVVIHSRVLSITVFNIVGLSRFYIIYLVLSLL